MRAGGVMLKAVLDVLAGWPRLADVAAFVIAYPLAAASSAGLTDRGQRWLELPLYLAFALAIAAGARIASRLAADTPRRGDGLAGTPPIGALPVDLRSEPSTGRSPRPPARAVAVEAVTPPQAANAQAGVSAPIAAEPREDRDVVARLRACMDEISYAAGTPNVLSMTKFVEPAPAAAPATCQREDRGDATVVRIGGVLDVLAVPGVRAVTDAVVAARRPSITLDLSALTLIDSTGVGLVVGIYKRATAAGGSVRVTGLAGQPLAVFRLMRLDRIFDLG